MFEVVLRSSIDSKSVYETFSNYISARDYANRLFHKRYTLDTRLQGLPADDLIVFKNTRYSEMETLSVSNIAETFTISINRINSAQSETTHQPGQDEKNFDQKLDSFKDHLDSIHIRQLLITEMLKSKPVCSKCGNDFESRVNITVKKFDDRIGYTRNNCFLKHRECRINEIRTNIQFIYSE